MDEHLRELLRAMLEADPDTNLDDDARQAMMYAMLALHSGEKISAIWKFAQSIENEFKRSHLLYNLVDRSAQHLQFDLAEKIARSIPEPYWRFDALNKIASELLRRDRESAPARAFGSNKLVPAAQYEDQALLLLSEIEKALPSIPEDDGDRASVLWSAGLSLVSAGKLEWAENLASTETYCPENTEVLLRCADAWISRGEIHRALQLASTVGKLASTGTGQDINRAYDLIHAAKILFNDGLIEEARNCLEQAAGFALPVQGNDIDGSKCTGAIAVEFARQGNTELAHRTAKMITQPARQEYALQQIAKLTETKSL